MTLQQLRDLLAVVTHGGFRAAARALDVSQAGLTKSLAKLEEEHGVALLDRTAKGITLTPAGQEFLSYAHAALLEADRAEEWLHNLRSQKAPSVALGVSIEPSLQLAPAVLADFRHAMPDTTVHISQSSSSELLAALRENRLELAVMRLPRNLEAKDLRIDVLYEFTAAIVARREHPLKAARSIRELCHLEWVVVGNPGQPAQHDESIRELFLEQQLGRPRLAAVSDSLFGAVSMLLESDCVARLPRQLLEHPLTGQWLTELRIREQQEQIHEIALVSKASRQLSREARQLGSMLKSYARVSRAVAAPRAAVSPALAAEGSVPPLEVPSAPTDGA
ncbi:MAG: LysR family transcriptional regulator [Pigmentiphaga sp.]|nr:LysR family transcriptional regulator [Pigmentiphaga sp.]